MRQRKVSDLQRLSPLKSRTPVCRDTPHEGLYTGPTPMTGPQAAPSSSIDTIDDTRWSLVLGTSGRGPWVILPIIKLDYIMSN